MRVLTIIGTRPEAIKLAPVIEELDKKDIKNMIISTGQHIEMTNQVLNLFKIEPDFDLALMQPNQNITKLLSEIINEVGGILRFYERVNKKPDLIIVQGDTTSALGGAIAGHYHQIPIAHVEAGLRSFDLFSPWPEEANRKAITSIAQLHFAPTFENQQNLIRENVPLSNIFIVGNTVIDALHTMVEKLKGNTTNFFPFLDPSKRTILVTGHRRETRGEGIETICKALKKISEDPRVQIVYPMHPSPFVQEPVNKILSNISNVHLIGPQDYLQFVDLMNRSDFVITDSGGIQEEAPSLGKSVLVTRDKTERGSELVKLVGTDFNLIVQSAKDLLDELRSVQPSTVFGDGQSADRIVSQIIKFLERK